MLTGAITSELLWNQDWGVIIEQFEFNSFFNIEDYIAAYNEKNLNDLKLL